MEGFSKAIQQPEYVHVLLNHFPITGLLVALVFLVVGIWGNNRVLLTVSLAAVSVLALSAWPVAHYGEQAYAQVDKIGSFRSELDMQRQNGTMIPVEATFSAIRSSDNSIKNGLNCILYPHTVPEPGLRPVSQRGQ